MLSILVIFGVRHLDISLKSLFLLLLLEVLAFFAEFAQALIELFLLFFQLLLPPLQ